MIFGMNCEKVLEFCLDDGLKSLQRPSADDRIELTAVFAGIQESLKIRGVFDALSISEALWLRGLDDRISGSLRILVPSLGR